MQEIAPGVARTYTSFVNAYFIGHGFCQGSPDDPSSDLKRECRAAYVLASALTGAAQLLALLCAPVFGYLSSKSKSRRAAWRGQALGAAKQQEEQSGGAARSCWRRVANLNFPLLVATSLGVVGYILILLDFHPASILLGFVLGPRFEENFRRALLIGHGDALLFVERPISAFFLLLCVVLVGTQIYMRFRKRNGLATPDTAIDALKV